jgi:RNA polymerase-interacting CarD/CdnL/TRCF family regulator
MVTCIYEKKRELAKIGKKLSVTDMTTLKSAEKLVEEEFAWALGIPQEEVPAFIRRRLHIREEE